MLEVFEKGPARLYPVSLLLDGKYYDASLYDSKPVPMALYSDTVYEAQKNGMPVGMFTVQRAARIETTWWGEGRWKPLAEDKDKDAKSVAKPAEGKDASKKDDKQTSAKAADDPDRPVLRKPAANAPAEPQVKSDPVVSTPHGLDARAAKAADEDPNRPTLRHGRPAIADVDEPLPTPGNTVGKPVSPGMKPIATYVAVSDEGAYDNHPYDYTASGAEVQHIAQMASMIAIAELRKFAAISARKLPESVALTNVETRGFDLDYSNSPYIVFSGQYTQPATPATKAGVKASGETIYSIFVIARMDADGKLSKIFSAATDNFHLDAYPQMELVDAVDVDGDSRGELLLRQVSDVKRSYVIYRADSYRVVKLFEGGSGR